VNNYLSDLYNHDIAFSKMNDLYGLGRLACIAFGIYIIKFQVKKIKDGTQDELGFGYKLLGGGVCSIIVGVGMILHVFK
jgi:hypothetical protein